ncbi:MAG: leucine-rich repeat domain-containing protein, partial [Metamycoplasmataceae bacterium]
MDKSKKSLKVLMTTTSLVVIGLGVNTYYLLNNNAKNSELVTLESLSSDTLITDNNPSTRMFEGTVLLKADVEALGWHTKENITLADWEQAPNVVIIGSTDSVTSPWAGNNIIKSIEIPSRVTEIRNSFRGSTITSVTFEANSNLSSIQNIAFFQARSLKSIDFPTSLERIGVGVFDSSGLESLNLPDTVVSLATDSFRSTNSLLGSNITMFDTLKGDNP